MALPSAAGANGMGIGAANEGVAETGNGAKLLTAADEVGRGCTVTHVTSHMSHVTRHTPHVTRHTSVTSHVTRHCEAPSEIVVVVVVLAAGARHRVKSWWWWWCWRRGRGTE